MHYSPIRFSRDKRFLQKVSFSEFLQAATAMVELVKQYRPDAAINVFTCEDLITYDYSTVTFLDEEIIQAMKDRKPYPLRNLTKKVWDRSYSIDLSINGLRHGDEDSFGVHVEVDRTASPHRMFFFSTRVCHEMDEAILGMFRRRSLMYGIGDGYPDVSDFNFAFGLRTTGIKI